MGVRDYKKDADELRSFFQKYYKMDDKAEKHFTYKNQIEALARREQTAIWIELEHLESGGSPAVAEIAAQISQNVITYQKLVADIIDELVQDCHRKGISPAVSSLDKLDIYLVHCLEAERRLQAAQTQLGANADQNVQQQQANIKKHFPPQLLRRFEVYFKPSPKVSELTVRQVKASQIGHLIAVRGLVTRETTVKPHLEVATYTCDACGAETYQEVPCGPSGSFMPLQQCPSAECTTNRSAGKLYFQPRGSKFIKFQELKIQELSDQVPVGHVPRTLTVYCRGENSRRAQPGDIVSLTGVFLPQIKSGFRAMNQGLLGETFLDAHCVRKLSKAELIEGAADKHQTEDVVEVQDEEFTEEELHEISSPNFYGRLAASIAPEIFGHDDIKKALLLLLVGGVDKTPKGMKIRGAINMCLMGDPGVAKSQLLGFIERLAPRCQYTTGRGSSGVGLTASVNKDPLTGEMVLEGGALVLADQGICCIDEFDKMHEADRVAIHEVMEQQTISIAKAGIMTTLNARVSILAAANPAYGRYNPRRTLEQNIDLPAALLSRFDLLWLVRDKPERDNDLRLAQHVTYLHQHNMQPPGGVVPFSMRFLRKYLIHCKRTQPDVPQELTERIVAAYVEMRRDARNQDRRHLTTFVSPRTLLAILRLSTALARLRQSTVVADADVAEATRLIEASKISLADSLRTNFNANPKSSMDVVYSLIRDMARRQAVDSEEEAATSEGGTVALADVFERAAAKGLSRELVEHCLEIYERMNVWMLNATRTRLTLVA